MFKKRIQIAAIERDLKHYQIAQLLGWHPSKLSQILIGARRPSDEDKRELADILNQSVDELFSTNEDAGVV